MNIIAVDDEKIQLRRVIDSINEYDSKINIKSFTNPLLVLEENDLAKTDVAILDIEMPGINGIELAKKLIDINPKINVIFVTGYAEYAIEAFNIYASGYITKPVNKAKIEKALSNLRYPIVSQSKIVCKCFGSFEAFYNNEPINFDRKKTKELFAYLVDRNGSICTMNEIASVLWEEGEHSSYLRMLVIDLKNTFDKLGISDSIVKVHNGCGVKVQAISCDYYDFLKTNDSTKYSGEYMSQYSWSEYTNAYIQSKISGELND